MKHKSKHYRQLLVGVLSTPDSDSSSILLHSYVHIGVGTQYLILCFFKDVPVFSSNDYTRDETFVQWKQNAIYICSSSQHIPGDIMRFVNLTFSRLSRELSQNKRIISCIVVGWEEMNIIELMSTVRQCSTQYRSRNVLMNAIVLKVIQLCTPEQNFITT